MQQLLNQIVALALVMIHRSTNLVNFAQGEMAMFSTYIAWLLIQSGLPYWVAFCLTIGASFAGGLAIHWLLMRPLAKAPVLATTIVFIGLLVIFNSVAGWLFTYSIQVFPSPFSGIGIGRGLFSAHDIGSIGVTLVLLVCLYLFFRFTMMGLRMRASAENPMSSRLLGVSVDHMLALGWGLAAAIGAIAGMMVAPVLYLDPNMMSGVLIYAFAAALLRCGGRRPDRRRARESLGRLCRRHRGQTHCGAGVDRLDADPEAVRDFRLGPCGPGVT
jgi:branched-chain amino acid transport system permease protein